jgi:glutaredoxin 3
MITVFTTNTCAYCKMVKQYLTMKGKEFEVVNLDDNPEKRQELINKTGAMTVPITQVGEEYIVGWNPSKLALV